MESQTIYRVTRTEMLALSVVRRSRLVGREELARRLGWKWGRLDSVLRGRRRAPEDLLARCAEVLGFRSWPQLEREARRLAVDEPRRRVA